MKSVFHKYLFHYFSFAFAITVVSGRSYIMLPRTKILVEMALKKNIPDEKLEDGTTEFQKNRGAGGQEKCSTHVILPTQAGQLSPSELAGNHKGHATKSPAMDEKPTTKVEEFPAMDGESPRNHIIADQQTSITSTSLPTQVCAAQFSESSAVIDDESLFSQLERVLDPNNEETPVLDVSNNAVDIEQIPFVITDCSVNDGPLQATSSVHYQVDIEPSDSEISSYCAENLKCTDSLNILVHKDGSLYETDNNFADPESNGLASYENDPDYIPSSCPSDSLPSSPENNLYSITEAEEMTYDYVPPLSVDEASSAVPEIGTETSTSDSMLQKKIRKRRRTSDPSSWNINVNKKMKRQCLPYKSKNGVPREAKQPKEVSCSKCYFKCSSKFTEEERQKVCKLFHGMVYERQKDFLIASTEITKIERKRAVGGSSKEKNNARRYFITNDGVKTRVCKTFFTKTLCISHGPIDKALRGKNPKLGVFEGIDNRGRKPPPNKTKPDQVKAVKDHIESFPAMESHYNRKDSKRNYLDSTLSISKMYALYQEQRKKDNLPEVSPRTYRRIFCDDYNLSFFKPKKDQCLTCSRYKDASEEKKSELQEEYDDHLKRKEEASNAKNMDKQRANNDAEFATATFDLQSVLQIPSSGVSQMYYSRKLNAFNLTVYEGARPNNGYCYCWSEINGSRGSSEIGTALMKWLQTLPCQVRQVSIFSDTCGGQNRNQHVASMLLFVVSTFPNLDVIEHKFLESGHSYMEADSMHSAIESAKTNVPIYTMQDWMTIMRLARSDRKTKNKPYLVTELKFHDFVDLKKLANSVIVNRSIDSNGVKVNWLKIKRLKYQKASPNSIFFSYDYNSEYHEILVNWRKNSSKITPTVLPTRLENLYKKLIPISKAKKEDLLKLCRSKAIPEEYHHWYEVLPVSAKKCSGTKDRIPEPSFSEEENEDLDP